MPKISKTLIVYARTLNYFHESRGRKCRKNRHSGRHVPEQKYGAENTVPFHQSPFQPAGGHMKKSILIAMTVLLAVSTGYGQQSKGKTDPDMRRHGLLFEVEGLNRLGVGSYGCGIGKKMFCGGYAFRPALVFSSYSSSENPGIADYVGDKESSTKIGIDFDFLKQPNTPGRLQLFYGLGVGYEIEKGKQEPSHEVQASATKVDSTGSTLRARGIVGAEFFITKHISLSGEYQLGYSHTSLKSKASYGTVSSPEVKTTTSRFKIGASPRLTLGLYF
jgi:hypothetical protein